MQGHYIKDKIKERYGTLTKENYLESIRKAGFQNPEILDEKLYIQEEEKDSKVDGKRRISSIVVKAVKD